MVGVDRSIYMKSTSGNDGSYTLTVSFDLGSNPDIDTVNVNNRVQTAQSQLPASVTLQGLTIRKRSSAVLQFMMLYSDNGKQDPLFITNYAVINVLDEISRTPGVGQALLFGKLNYSMRIWFDTQRLTALNLAPLRRHQRDQRPEQSGRDRPHRRAPGPRHPAVPAQPANDRAARHIRPVRRHRAARQPRRLEPQDQGRRPRRTRRAERGHRELSLWQAGSGAWHLPLARAPTRCRRPPLSTRR